MATSETTNYLWLIAGLLILALFILGTLGTALQTLTERNAKAISKPRAISGVTK